MIEVGEVGNHLEAPERTSMFWKLRTASRHQNVPCRPPAPACWSSLTGKLHFKHELIVALVGVVLPLTTGVTVMRTFPLGLG